jgi:lipopolysaccharide export system protein LptA
VRRWARWNSVENVVVGRVDRAGERGLRAAIELRSGHSGAARAEYRLEPDEAEDWGGAVTQLAILILAEVEASAPDAPARATSAEPGPAAEPGADAEPGRGEEGGLRLLPGVSRDDPISIESDELEVLPEDGGRRLVFSRNVRVQQGDITLEADRLEAVYPQGASQPDLLLASGRVRVVQGDRRGRCDEAIYDRDAQTIVCRGKAEVTQGCDQVRGEEIEFDLARERVRVTGAASVVIQPGSAEDGDCVPSVASNAPPEAAR